MKGIFSLILFFVLVLSMGVIAHAMEGVEGNEPLQVSENQKTVTVATLEELQAAVAAAEDGDTKMYQAEECLSCCG